MRLTTVAGLLLGCCGVLLLGCANGERTAEREIVAAAPRYIGPADRYDADVQGLSTSRAQRVQLIGYGVQPEPNLRLQTLTLTFTDVAYQRTPFQITRIGNAQFVVQATDAAVTNYVIAKAPQPIAGVTVRNPQVTFLQDQVRMAGVAVVDAQELPITTTGILVPQGSRVLYQPQTVTVENTARGELLRTALTRVQIPLVDLSRLSFAPQIQTIVVRPGLVTLSGTGDANQLLTPARP